MLGAADRATTLGENSIPNYEAMAFVTAGFELFEDANGFVSTISEMFADAKPNLEEPLFVADSGSGQSTGIVTALVAGSKIVNAVADGTLTEVDLYAPRYQNKPNSWVMNRSTAAEIRQFYVSTSGSGAGALASKIYHLPELRNEKAPTPCVDSEVWGLSSCWTSP